MLYGSWLVLVTHVAVFDAEVRDAAHRCRSAAREFFVYAIDPIRNVGICAHEEFSALALDQREFFTRLSLIHI